MRTLPPWETIQYFKPQSGNATINAVATQILTWNPHRVGVIFSNVSGVGLSVSPFDLLLAGSGFVFLAANSPPLALTHRDWGVLVQSDWWALGTGAGATVAWIELLLTDWPRTAQESKEVVNAQIKAAAYAIDRHNGHSSDRKQPAPRFPLGVRSTDQPVYHFSGGRGGLG